MADLQVVADLARLLHGRFELHALDAQAPFAGLLRSDELLQRKKLTAQIEIMDKGVLFVSYIDECRIETRHDLTYFSEVDIPDGEPGLTLLLVEFDKDLVLAQRDGNFGRVDVYN
ncbi:MAG: hypothetical protein ACLUNN_09075 [Alistipes finegoldii]